MSLTRGEIESFRGDRIIYTKTCLQIQTCSKGSSDHHRNLRSCDYYCGRTSRIMFGLLIVLVHSCNILIKCTNYCYTLGMNHILILEVVRHWQKLCLEKMGKQYQSFEFLGVELESQEGGGCKCNKLNSEDCDLWLCFEVLSWWFSEGKGDWWSALYIKSKIINGLLCK